MKRENYIDDVLIKFFQIDYQNYQFDEERKQSILNALKIDVHLFNQTIKIVGYVVDTCIKSTMEIRNECIQCIFQEVIQKEIESYNSEFKRIIYAVVFKYIKEGKLCKN